MARSAVSTVQMAVANLGQTEIVTDITVSPQTKAEKLAQVLFDETRDRVNAKHNWSWATRRATLTDVTVTEGRQGWVYAYSLPADMLRFVGLDLGYRSGPDPAGLDPVNPTLPGASWTIEMNVAGTGRVLLCDIQNAVGVYVARVTTLDLWDPDAYHALVWELTNVLAMPLTSKSDWAQLSEQKSERTRNGAIADDSNEAHPDHESTSEIITSRAW